MNRLQLVIEDGKHHFYTERGERIDYIQGTTIRQDTDELWGSGRAVYDAWVFVGRWAGDKERGLRPCKYDKRMRHIVTPNLNVIDAYVVDLDSFEGAVESVRIMGICKLLFETKHKDVVLAPKLPKKHVEKIRKKFEDLSYVGRSKNTTLEASAPT